MALPNTNKHKKWGNPWKIRDLPFINSKKWYIVTAFWKESFNISRKFVLNILKWIRLTWLKNECNLIFSNMNGHKTWSYIKISLLKFNTKNNLLLMKITWTLKSCSSVQYEKIAKNLECKKSRKTKMSSVRKGKLYRLGNFKVRNEILGAWIWKSCLSNIYLNSSLLKEEALGITNYLKQIG